MITQTKFYQKYDGLAFWFVSGLIVGFVYSLAFGLVWGLVWGLVFGLVFGLLFGLLFGLAFWLVCGFVIILIHFKEALSFLYGFYPILFLVIGILILTELLFILMPREKLKKETNLFWHTCKRKLECFIEVVLGFFVIAQIYILIREGRKYITQEVYNEILKWIGYIGMGIIVLGLICLIFYIWIKLNERKYKR